MDTLNEKRMHKDRGQTPKEVLEEVMRDYGDATDVVIVTRNKDGITTHWSCDDPMQVIGALEVAKIAVSQS